MRTKVISLRTQSLSDLALSDAKSDRKYAYKHIASFTSEELLYFASRISAQRGWGSGLRKAISRWYSSRTPDQIRAELEVGKAIAGWDHALLIRMAHPTPSTQEHSLLFRDLLRRNVA